MHECDRKDLQRELRKALAPFIPDEGLLPGARLSIIEDVTAFAEMLIETRNDPSLRGRIDPTGTKLRMTLAEP